VIDLILNDGAMTESVLGDAAPAWRSEDEKQAVNSLIETLKKTPEELSVKTQGLNALIALDSPEALGVLLHYLEQVYDAHGRHPTLWRHLVPHMSLPQEAENVEDIVHYLAERERGRAEPERAMRLKALHVYLRRAYESQQAGVFFQLMDFLKAFDPAEYQAYVEQTQEQIRIMRIVEYATSTRWFWLAFWPISLIALLALSYGVAPLLRTAAAPAAGGRRAPLNRRSNPAADARNASVAPPAAIAPIKLMDVKHE
jgi:hypothetical protein